jgi:WD40 repeat protein
VCVCVCVRERERESQDTHCQKCSKHIFGNPPSCLRTRTANACEQAAMPKHKLEGTIYVCCVAFSSDGRDIVCGCGDGTVIMWRASDGQLLHKFKAHESSSMCLVGVLSLDLSKDGKLLVSGGGYDFTVKLWALHGEQPPTLQQTLEGHSDGVNVVRFSPDIMMIASASDDGTVRVCIVQSGELLRTYSGHKVGVHCAAWSPNSKRVASGGDDKVVHVWNVDDAKLAMQPLQGHGHVVMSAAFSADGSLLVSGSWDKTIIIWGLVEGREATLKLKLEGHTCLVNSIALSPDDRYVVSAGRDGTVRVWEVATGQPIRVLQGHTRYIQSVAWSSDGNLIASGGGDQKVCVWEADVQVRACAHV